jgi:hypothetical protein
VLLAREGKANMSTEAGRIRDARDAMLTALQRFAGVPCEFLLLTNSIRLRLDISKHPNGRAYFWIDPPWRLMHGDVLVTGSNESPRESAEDESGQWRAWFDKFRALEQPMLVDVAVGLEYPDLHLRFTCGYRIETFSEGGPGCWWYYLDRETGDIFEAGAYGISRKREEIFQ